MQGHMGLVEIDCAENLSRFLGSMNGLIRELENLGSMGIGLGEGHAT